MASSDERRIGEGGGEEKKRPRQIILANWGDRLLAWIVDFILEPIPKLSSYTELYNTTDVPVQGSSLISSRIW